MSILAAEEHNPLLPPLGEIIIGLIAFGIVLLVMFKFVAPRFEQVFRARREAIEGGMERAEAMQAEAQAALEQYRAQLSDSRAEAARIREDAKTQGSQILAEMREQAQAEATRIREQTQAQLAAERSQAMNQLRNEVGGLATTLAGRIVGESLDDDERARRTVDRFIADLEAQAPADGTDGRNDSHAYSGADPA